MSPRCCNTGTCGGHWCASTLHQSCVHFPVLNTFIPSYQHALATTSFSHTGLFLDPGGRALVCDEPAPAANRAVGYAPHQLSSNGASVATLNADCSMSCSTCVHLLIPAVTDVKLRLDLIHGPHPRTSSMGSPFRTACHIIGTLATAPAYGPADPENPITARLAATVRTIHDKRMAASTPPAPHVSNTPLACPHTALTLIHAIPPAAPARRLTHHTVWCVTRCSACGRVPASQPDQAPPASPRQLRWHHRSCIAGPASATPPASDVHPLPCPRAPAVRMQDGTVVWLRQPLVPLGAATRASAAIGSPPRTDRTSLRHLPEPHALHTSPVPPVVPRPHPAATCRQHQDPARLRRTHADLQPDARMHPVARCEGEGADVLRRLHRRHRRRAAAHRQRRPPRRLRLAPAERVAARLLHVPPRRRGRRLLLRAPLSLLLPPPPPLLTSTRCNRQAKRPRTQSYDTRYWGLHACHPNRGAGIVPHAVRHCASCPMHA